MNSHFESFIHVKLETLKRYINAVGLQMPLVASDTLLNISFFEDINLSFNIKIFISALNFNILKYH